MNILVINQPIGNRGDESAHRALMRSLTNKYPNHNFSIAFFGDREKDVQQININAHNGRRIWESKKTIDRFPKDILV